MQFTEYESKSLTKLEQSIVEGKFINYICKLIR